MEMGRKPLPRVRPISRETRFLRLRSLKCFQEVLQRVKDGWTASAIAAFIQDERQGYTDITRNGLEIIIGEFRNTLPRADLVAAHAPTVVKKAIQEVQEGVDEIHELNRLYRMQMDRIKIDMETERKIGKLFPTLTKDITVAAEILEKIVNVKMDVGLLDRNLGTLEIDATMLAGHIGKYGKESVAKVMENAESRRRVMGVAERLLLLGGKKVEVKEDDDSSEEDVIDVVPVAVGAEK